MGRKRGLATATVADFKWGIIVKVLKKIRQVAQEYASETLKLKPISMKVKLKSQQKITNVITIWL